MGIWFALLINSCYLLCSDDRSAELFKNKLETTTQMISCMGEGNKPNCLIIDEIDGAPVVINYCLIHVYFISLSWEVIIVVKSF